MLEQQTLERTARTSPGNKLRSWRLPAALLAPGILLGLLYFRLGDLQKMADGISGYIALFILQFALYLVACFAALKLSAGRSRRARIAGVAVVLVFAALFRAELAYRTPYLSTDAYRYVWDGRVQAHHINPFRYIPSARQLSYLRDRRIYPNINGATYERTPYPPAAEAIFLGLYLVHPLSVTAFKMAFSIFDLITIGALMVVLARSKLDPERAVIYAWHPLLLWEGAHSGHVDLVFIMFLALALLAWSSRKPALTGAALALATMVKLFPIILLPVFLSAPEDILGRGNTLAADFVSPRKSPSSGGLFSLAPATAFTRDSIRTLAGFALTAVVCCLPYLTAGSSSFTFTRGYLQEEGFVKTGRRYLLLALLRKVARVPTSAYIVGALTVLMLFGLWWLVRRKLTAVDVARGSLAMIGAYLLLTTPRYPWYFCWLVPFLCFEPDLAWLYLSGATVLLYTLWFVPNEYPGLPFWLGAALYAPTLALLARDLIKRRANRQPLAAVPV